MTELHRYPALTEGVLLRRYHRFLADVRLRSGRTVTAFCPNTGSMLGLTSSGTPALLSESRHPARKTAWTLEMLKPGRSWVAVNTHLTNRLAAELVSRELLGPPFRGYRTLRSEPQVPEGRLDLLLSRGRRSLYVEVKSVTLKVGPEARFPDALTERGGKHLSALMEISRSGHEALMLYLVQRADCHRFAPAADIDPAYATALREAWGAGVAIRAFLLSATPRGIRLLRPLTVNI